MEALTALVPIMLSMMETTLPLLAKSGVLGSSGPIIEKIIEGIVVLTPVIKQEYTDLKPRVLAVITALKADPATNAAQLIILEQQAEVLDAEFDSGFSDALAEDAAAAKAGK